MVGGKWQGKKTFESRMYKSPQTIKRENTFKTLFETSKIQQKHFSNIDSGPFWPFLKTIFPKFSPPAELTALRGHHNPPSPLMVMVMVMVMAMVMVMVMVGPP